MGVIDFYDRHPIDEDHVLTSATRRRGTLAGLRAEDLFEFDQDHYGGLPAVEALARRASLAPGCRVLDVCAGLGGPARFVAQRLGCRVVALELNHRRAAGAARLTRRVGWTGLVAVVRGDAAALPLASGRFDACLSQEGLLHIEDKAAVLGECRRVLVPGAGWRSPTGSPGPVWRTASGRGCVSGWRRRACRRRTTIGASWAALASRPSTPRTSPTSGARCCAVACRCTKPCARTWPPGSASVGRR